MTEDRRLLVDKADVVSFDLFDTLFVRTVLRPRDAFCLAQEIFNEKSDRYLTGELGPVRLNAEIELRTEAVGVGASADSVALAEIYRRVASLGGLPDSMADELMAAELQAERLLLRPTGLLALLRYAIEQSKEVIVASDTYLPREFIVELLGNAGIGTGYELWLSCERKASKADGSLWAQVVAPRAESEVVHFGDNFHSDVVQARAFGVRAEKERNRPEELRQGIGAAGALHGEWVFNHLDVDGFRLKNLHRSLVGGLVANRLAEDDRVTPPYAVGYGALGPLLLGYVQWLHRAARASGYRHLYFLARDGRIMQEAYDAYWESTALPSTYLFASRRLLRFSAFGERLTNSDLDFLTQTSWRMPVWEYFTRLALPDVADAAMALLERQGIDPLAAGDEHSAEIRAVFWQLQEMLVTGAKVERGQLVDYWEEAGLLRDDAPVVVDIGWHGSLQQAIARTLQHAGRARDVRGLYFALHAERGLAATDVASAFIDGASDDDAPVYQNLVKGSVAPLEFCFTQPQGTVVGLRYRTAAGDDRSQPGWTAQHAEDRLPEADAQVLEELQRAAVDFVRDFRLASEEMPRTVVHIERDVAVENMVMLLSAPTAAAAEVLGRRHHSDGHGAGVGWRLIGAPSHDADWYREHPERLASELAEAEWRAGFIANCRALGIPVD